MELQEFLCVSYLLAVKKDGMVWVAPTGNDKSKNADL
jgi:hypothetical protein